MCCKSSCRPKRQGGILSFISDDKTTGEKIREGKEYAKKIKICTVDCLLKEFGGFE